MNLQRNYQPSFPRFPSLACRVARGVLLPCIAVSASAVAGGTTTTLTSANSSPVYGQQVSFTATVTGSNPTGSVAFTTSDGKTTICAAASFNGSGNTRTAKCNWHALFTPGSYDIIARYAGDANNNTSISNAVNEFVSQAQSVVSASVSPTPLVLNQPAVVSVSVKAVAPGSGSPTGEVDVSFGDATCTFNLPTNNSCSITAKTLGSGTLNVAYDGDANFAGNFFSKTNTVVPGTTTRLASSANPSPLGSTVVLTATVTGSAPTGKVVFLDGNTPLCSSNGVLLASRQASCSAIALTAGSHTITANYSGDASNGASSGTLTQVVENGAPVNLDQQGITGFWYNPSTPGQGFVLQVYPDLNGVNNGLLAGSWFTFDVAPSGSVNKQRWYTFGGSVSNTEGSAAFTIDTALGGNFNAGPVVGAITVGKGSLELVDCSHGNLSYQFTDGSGLASSIPLTRIAANVSCGTNGNNGAAAGGYLLSGAWYDPNTSGQGLLFEVNPDQKLFAAAWYTFAPNGSSIDGDASQRWYTLQTSYTQGDTTIDNIPIYTAINGVFDNNATTTTLQVGTAKVVFSSCSAATLSYAFAATSLDNAGQSGTIQLQRLGPAPTGCSL